MIPVTFVFIKFHSRFVTSSWAAAGRLITHHKSVAIKKIMIEFLFMLLLYLKVREYLNPSNCLPIIKSIFCFPQNK
jgi:hypothetical protein